MIVIGDRQHLETVVQQVLHVQGSRESEVVAGTPRLRLYKSPVTGLHELNGLCR